MRVTASTLNVRSGPGVDFSTINKLFMGDSVKVLEQRGDWARIDPCGWVSSMYLAAAFVRAPNGIIEIESQFGMPGSPAASSGRVRLPAPLKLGWQNSFVTRVACHIEMEEIFAAVFGAIYSRGHWKLIRTYDGIYRDRDVKKGGGKKSTHAWGIAIDLNAETNRKNPGDMPEQLIQIFEEHGFRHGREFNDPMHFQYASGY